MNEYQNPRTDPFTAGAGMADQLVSGDVMLGAEEQLTEYLEASNDGN
ncbi:MAG: hypothetical protein ACLQU4_22110 [Limisphaerales bacterium]